MSDTLTVLGLPTPERTPNSTPSGPAHGVEETKHSFDSVLRTLIAEVEPEATQTGDVKEDSAVDEMAEDGDGEALKADDDTGGEDPLSAPPPQETVTETAADPLTEKDEVTKTGDFGPLVAPNRQWAYAVKEEPTRNGGHELNSVLLTSERPNKDIVPSVDFEADGQGGGAKTEPAKAPQAIAASMEGDIGAEQVDDFSTVQFRRYEPAERMEGPPAPGSESPALGRFSDQRDPSPAACADIARGRDMSIGFKTVRRAEQALDSTQTIPPAIDALPAAVDEPPADVAPIPSQAMSDATARQAPEFSAPSVKTDMPVAISVPPNQSVNPVPPKEPDLKGGETIAPVDAETSLQMHFDAKAVRDPGNVANQAQRAQPAETARDVARQLASEMPVAPDGQVEIGLNPKELGRVRMHVSLTDGGVALAVSAERAETLDLMRRHSFEMNLALRDLGYENVTLSFGSDAKTDDPGAQTAASGIERANEESDAGLAQFPDRVEDQRQTMPTGRDRLDLRI